MDVRRKMVEKACQPDAWEFGNGVLYDLCREHAGHRDSGVVIAKVWLIGRAYAAAVERRRTKDKAGEDNDEFYRKKVAPALMRSEIDDRLRSLRRFDGVERCVGEVIECHGYLTGVFRRVSGLEKRSLASNYLHFHLPGHFFIYDIRAAFGLSKVAPRCRVPEHRSPNADPVYAGFALKLLALQARIAQDFGERLTPRQVDRLLLNEAV